MEIPIAYSNIEDVYSVSRWDSSQKFYIRIVIPDGSVLLQVCGPYWSNDTRTNCLKILCSFPTNGFVINGSILSTGR